MDLGETVGNFCFLQRSPIVYVADDIEAVGMLAPSQPLAFVDRGGFDVAVTDSHVAIRQVVSVLDKAMRVSSRQSFTSCSHI